MVRKSGVFRTIIQGLKSTTLWILPAMITSRHGMPLEVADGGAEAAQPAPLKVLADFGQLGIGMADDAQAVDFRPLPPQGLDDQQRIASPAGHQADAGRGRGQGS